MNYSLKAKCQGCMALSSGKEFTCLFGIPLIVEETQGNQSKPQPNEVKCFKPKSTNELREARKLMKNKTVCV